MNKGFRCFQFVVSVEDEIILLKPLCVLILSEKNARFAIFSDRFNGNAGLLHVCGQYLYRVSSEWIPDIIIRFK